MKTRNIISALVLCVAAFSVKAQHNDSTAHYRHYMPNIIHAQFAGNIGMGALGLGYDLYQDKFQAGLLYGYVPPMHGAKSINTLALKMSAAVFKVPVRRATLKAYAGFTVNYETGNSAFLVLPEYFPNGYYPTGNAVHATLFLGLRYRVPLQKHIKNGWYIEPYIESGGLDTDLWYAASIKAIRLEEIVTMAIGVNVILPLCIGNQCY